MLANFVVTVYLATQFRVGLSMFLILFLQLRYFWKAHSNFVLISEKELLDNKLLSRKQT
jgi:hypothetical protein